MTIQQSLKKLNKSDLLQLVEEIYGQYDDIDPTFIDIYDSSSFAAYR